VGLMSQQSGQVLSAVAVGQAAVVEGQPVGVAPAAVGQAVLPSTVAASIPKRTQSSNMGFVLSEAHHPSGAQRVVIKRMLPGTPAYDAALSVGDPVLLINGKGVPTAAVGHRLLRDAPAGEVEVQVARSRTERTLLLRKSGGEDLPIIQFGLDDAWDGSQRVIVKVPPSSAVAGLTYGDSVIAINRVCVKSAQMASDLLREAPPGDVELRIATDSNTYVGLTAADTCFAACVFCSIQ